MRRAVFFSAVYVHLKVKMPLFESSQSRLLLALALPVIVLTQRTRFNMVTMIAQVLLYLSLAYNADCLVSGDCRLWAWAALLFPVINTIGFLFFTDKLNLNPPVLVPIPRGWKRDENAH